MSTRRLYDSIRTMPRRSLGQASLLLLGSTWIHSGLGLARLGADRPHPRSRRRRRARPQPGSRRPRDGRRAARLRPGPPQAPGRGRGPGPLPGHDGADPGGARPRSWASRCSSRGGRARWPSAPAGAAVFVFMLGSQVALRLADVFMQVFIVRERVVTHGAILLSMRLARLVATAVVLWSRRASSGSPPPSCSRRADAVVSAGASLATSGIRPRGAVAGEPRRLLALRPARSCSSRRSRCSRTRSIACWSGAGPGSDRGGHYQVARGLFEALSGVMAPPGMLHVHAAVLALRRADTGARPHGAPAVLQRPGQAPVPVAPPWPSSSGCWPSRCSARSTAPSFVAATPALRILVLAALAATRSTPTRSCSRPRTRWRASSRSTSFASWCTSAPCTC